MMSSKKEAGYGYYMFFALGHTTSLVNDFDDYRFQVGRCQSVGSRGHLLEMVGGIDLLGGQRLVPDTHFRDLAVEITVAGIRIADPEATGLAVRLVGMLHAEIHGRGTDVAAALLHTVEKELKWVNVSLPELGK